MLRAIVFGGCMNRRLACLSIPDFPLQVLLHSHPEWKGDAIVLLDRDEARGRIIEANAEARALGIGRGMLYGPCLGIHGALKAGVLQDSVLESWREKIEMLLSRFSPHAERSSFHSGTYWVDATGLSSIFPSVRPWLEELRSSVENLGLSCGAAAGSSRFATYAAALLRFSGPVSLFAGSEAEENWLRLAPVDCLPMKADTARTLKRLNLLTVGDILAIPLPDIRRRLDSELAEMVAFIRDERRLPIQPVLLPEPAEWTFPLEDPTDSLALLSYGGSCLIERCIALARRRGLYVSSLVFELETTDAVLTLPLKPAHPSRDGDCLKRLLEARLSYTSLDAPVRELRCRGNFARPGSSYVDLFTQNHRRQRQEAAEALGVFQAERGTEAVQFARIIDDPLPLRQFSLRPWRGFPRATGKGLSGISPGHPPGYTAEPLFLTRRISLGPKSLDSGIRKSADVAYSGGWWSVPYRHEMAYARVGGRCCWLSSEGGNLSWKLIGWLD